jgi:hypothetical protein
VAALVPSAGTITLQIESRFEAGAGGARIDTCPRVARLMTAAYWIATIKRPYECGGISTPSLAMTRGQNQEYRPMWPYVQMWFPLLTIALTAAICFGVVSFIMGHAKPQP